MESQRLHPQHGETIVPVKPTIRKSAAASAPAPRAWLGVTVAGVLSAAALALVFVVLPKWVAGSAQPPAAAAVAVPADAPPPQPQRSREELAALAAEAEKLLAQLLTQTARLEDQGAQGWGGADWEQYAQLSKVGDEAYLAEAFWDAVSSYTQALAVGEALFERSVQSVERAIAAAGEAFAAGNAQLAIEQYDFALGIDPASEAAQRGRARAERLPEVLDLVRAANALRDAGELDEALATYRRALAIDPGWEPAQTAVDAVASRIENDRFDGLLSNGYAALAAEDFARAEEHFKAALAMRPSAAPARDGLVQAEEGGKLDQIALAEARALAFERRERWDQAIAQYEAALATDAALAFAKTGLARATARADLGAKLDNLIENPTLLFDDAVLNDARKLSDQAAAVPEPGPRLTEQKAELDRLLALATTPLKVQLSSDALTDVTVYRVGPLGAFTSKELELKPGTYTAIGSRNGFRDVRQTFTVWPGRELAPISVVCSEPI